MLSVLAAAGGVQAGLIDLAGYALGLGGLGFAALWLRAVYR